MEPERLRELATNAQLDHWPPHLGVKTDAEKIQYLADRLRETADYGDAELVKAEERIESLEDETLDLEQKIDRLEDEKEKLKTENEELKAKLA